MTGPRTICVLLTVATGCASVPHPQKYFDRQTAFNTLNGFAYAVETDHWDWAYDCLTEASRERLSKFRMRAAIGFFSFPDTDIPMYDVIVNSRRDRDADPAGAGTRVFMLDHEQDDDAITLWIYVEKRAVTDEEGREVERWEIDLVRTITEIGGALD